MQQFLTCPKGHRWEFRKSGAPGTAQNALLCPVCGDSAETIPFSGTPTTLSVGQGKALPTTALDMASPVTTQPHAEVSSTQSSLQSFSVPGYEIVEEIGHGGMGVVYKARQTSLNRIVALKMLMPGADTRPKYMARFQTEAEAVARLQHPNIVQIFQVGEAQGRPFLALEFVEGQSLDGKIDARPQRPGDSAKLVEIIARAMHFAHQRDIVHRDLKPANVLLTADGVPKITDFGLAKRLESGSGLTQSGDVMGTPSYMAPEQARGDIQSIGPRTDVYALGAVLYEMLTGRPPFHGGLPLLTLRQVLQDEPVPPSRLQPEVPIELETICLKCLEKEPSKRYVDAEALAEDLRRFQANEPIAARPVSTWERGIKWAKRRPALAALFAVSLLAALALTIGGLSYNARLRSALHRTEQEREFADQQRDVAQKKRIEAEEQRDLARQRETTIRRYLYATQMKSAQDAWDRGDVSGVDGILESLQPAEGQEDLRGFEWYYFRKLTHGYRLSLEGHTKAVGGVAFSPDGKLLASASDDCSVKMWDTKKGEEIFTHKVEQATFREVAFSPDGKLLLAVADNQGMVYIWDAATGKNLVTFAAEQGGVKCLAISPDGKTLATGSYAKSIKLWSIPDPIGPPVERAHLLGHTEEVFCLAFSKDGATLASGDGSLSFALGEIKIWDVAQARAIAGLKGHSRSVASVAFSPDGKTLASASWDQAVKLWDLPSGKERINLPHKDLVSCVGFSPNGKLLITGSGERNVRGELKFWDPATGKEVSTLFGHSQGIKALSVSPDGTTVATGGPDSTVKLWDVPTARTEKPNGALFPKARSKVLCLAFSPDGTTLASGSHDGMVKVWDTKAKKESAALPQRSGAVESVSFSPDGKELGVATWSSMVRLWDMHSASGIPEELPSIVDSSGKIIRVAFSPSGKTMATGDRDGDIKLWRPGNTGPVAVLKGHTHAIRSMAFSADGRTLVSGGNDETVRLWDVPEDLKNPRPLTVLKGHKGTVWCVAFSPSGRFVASGGDDRAVRLWEITSSRQVATFQGMGSCVSCVSFSPDGMVLVAGGSFAGNFGLLKVWEANDTGANSSQGKTLKPPSGHIHSLAFSSQGSVLATGSAEGTVELWDTETWEAQARLPGHANTVLCAAFSPDGKTLAVGKADFTVRLLNTDTWAETKALIGHSDSVSCLAISPDGTRLATGSYDRTVKVWELSSGHDLATFLGHIHPVRSVTFSPDGHTLASGAGHIDARGEVKLWDLALRREQATLKEQRWMVRSALFSPDGKSLITASGDGWNNIAGELKIWAWATGEELATFTPHRGPISSIALSPDGKELVTGSWDKTLKLCDLQAALTGTINFKTFEGHGEGLTCTAYSHDAKLIASGDFSGVLKLWDPVGGRELAALKEHTRMVTCLAFSPDNRKLVSGSLDGSLRLWESASKEEVLAHKTRERSGHLSYFRQGLVPEFHLAEMRLSLAIALRSDGRLKEAEESCQNARKGLESLVSQFPDQPEYRKELSAVLSEFSVLLSVTNRPEEAKQAYEQSLELIEKVVAEFLEDSSNRFRLAKVLNNRVIALARVGEKQEAEEVFRQTEPVWERLAADVPGLPSFARDLPRVANELLSLSETQGGSEKAKHLSVLERQLWGKLETDFVKEQAYWEDFSRTLCYLGQTLGEPSGQEKAFRNAVMIGRDVLSGRTASSDHGPYFNLYCCLQVLGDFLLKSRRFQEGEEAYQEAITLAQKLADESAFPPYRDDLAILLERLAILRNQWGHFHDAEANYGQAFSIRATLLKDHPSESKYLAGFTNTVKKLLELQLAQGQPKEAMKTLLQASSLLEKLAVDFPSLSDYRQNLGHVLDWAGTQMVNANHLPEAEEAYRQALGHYEKLAGTFPDKPQFRNHWAFVFRNLGALLERSGRLQEAEEAYQRAIKLNEQLSVDFPSVPDYRQNLSHCLDKLGSLLHKDTKRYQEAERCYRQALTHASRLVGEMPDKAVYHSNAAIIAGNLGNLLRKANQREEAEKAYLESASHRVALVMKFPQESKYLNDYKDHLKSLFSLYDDLPKLQMVLKVARQKVTLYEKLNTDFPGMYQRELVEACNGLAWMLVTSADEELQSAAEAVGMAKKGVELSPQAGHVWNTLGVAYYRAGKWKEALAALEKSMNLRGEKADSFDWFFAAMAHWQLGEKEQALESYRKAIEWMEKNSPDDKELQGFKAEAMQLLGIPPSSKTE